MSKFILAIKEKNKRRRKEKRNRNNKKEKKIIKNYDTLPVHSDIDGQGSNGR